MGTFLYKNILTREFLIKEHIKNKKSISQIAKETGLYYSTIYRYMSLNDIEISNSRKGLEPNQIYNNLTTKKIIGKTKDGSKIWCCKCKCGNFIKAEGGKIKAGQVKSCGCLQKIRKKGKESIFWKGVGDISKSKWSSFVYSARNRNIQFDLTIDQGWKILKQQGNICPLSNLKISFDDNTISLDRIDSNGIYEINNVWWIHKDINKIKFDLSVLDFIKLCTLVTYPIKQINNTKNIKIYKGFFNHIKRLAKKRNLDFCIDEKYLIYLFKKQNGLCKVTGQKIKIPSSSKQYKNKNFTASLDRINNNLGYKKRNLQWVHKKINQSKWNFNTQQYKNLCKLVYEHSLQKEI